MKIKMLNGPWWPPPPAAAPRQPWRQAGAAGGGPERAGIPGRVRTGSSGNLTRT